MYLLEKYFFSSPVDKCKECLATFVVFCERVRKLDVMIYRMFMYIFLGGLVCLMLFGMYQVLESRTVRTFPFSLMGNDDQHTLYLLIILDL